ncbi:putative periplasmic protein [Candidatus Accumulibacter aalborgensis]|uniref:Putative periplasmic protein n=1 Tax=Candidatus Accumulibacter aalborgensis TaxID=1860102 RepID=A0A1A8XEJ2_9PROT|nr:DUF2092 domain-containing protein [Candidatus Accumulibacter aalborgensis]SBT03609.1 putative periplasmic protein [Candidatus Accumulibacter aalborgensis]
MVRQKLCLSLLALSLAAPGLYAEPAPASTAQPVVNVVDPGSIQALKKMGAYLQTLHRFQARTELSSETVLEDGQKLQQSSSAEIQVQRPNSLRALMWSARAERELIYDGKTATLYTPALKYYATTEVPATIGGMIDQLEVKYGVQVPLQDLFLWGTDAAPLDKIDSAMNAGQDFIGKDLCDHYAFRQGTIDWQIWITTGEAPLPRKLVITNRADEARPQSVSYMAWNLKPTFKDTIFKFTPPSDARAIGIRPLNSQ